MKQLALLVTTIAFIACNNRKNAPIPGTSPEEKLATISEKVSDDTSQFLEVFIDSLNIGRKTRNKVEIRKYVGTHDSIFVQFYSKRDGKWIVRNDYSFEGFDLEIPVLNTNLSDFNNDGLNDLTYISAVAARGANEVRSLFIYNPSKDKLQFIKNSENYPNIHYNKKLDCITAFRVYGGCSTDFLRIDGDNLKEFACVKVERGITVSTFDQSGRETIIFQDTTHADDCDPGPYEDYRTFRTF